MASGSKEWRASVVLHMVRPCAIVQQVQHDGSVTSLSGRKKQRHALWRRVQGIGRPCVTNKRLHDGIVPLNHRRAQAVRRLTDRWALGPATVQARDEVAPIRRSSSCAPVRNTLPRFVSQLSRDFCTNGSNTDCLAEQVRPEAVR